MVLRRRWSRRRAKQALESARVLDEVVAAQLRLVPGLDDAARRRAADHLAELVLLAQANRYFAAGWISRRELDERGARAMRTLAELRQNQSRLAQLTERD